MKIFQTKIQKNKLYATGAFYDNYETNYYILDNKQIFAFQYDEYKTFIGTASILEKGPYKMQLIISNNQNIFLDKNERVWAVTTSDDFFSKVLKKENHRKKIGQCLTNNT